MSDLCNVLRLPYLMYQNTHDSLWQLIHWPVFSLIFNYLYIEYQIYFYVHYYFTRNLMSLNKK